MNSAADHKSGAAKRKFGVKSLRVRFVLLVLACYLLPALVLGGYTQAVLLPAMERNTETAISASTQHALSQTIRNIDRVIELARDATYDGELLEIYQSWQAETLRDAEFLRMSRNYLERKYSRETLFQYATYFAMKAPELLATAGSGRMDNAVTMREICRQMLENSVALDTQCLFVEMGGDLYLVRNLMDLRMERFGMLVLKVDQERLFTAVQGLESTLGAKVTLGLDEFGEPAETWTGRNAGFTENRPRYELYYVSRNAGVDYDFRLLLTLNKREIYATYYLYRRLTAVIFLLLIPVLIFFMSYTRKRILRPIESLSDAAQRIEAGELGVTVPMHGDDEIGRLGVSFSKMSLRIEELINVTYKEELELKNAQILALQSRINPHFINNALEEINWMARIEGADSVSSMITSLSVLLNAAMARDNRRTTTLREELSVAEAYAFFAQQRFGASLEILREMEEDAMDCVLPLMTVQPLMENAVEHGIAPASGGRITLRARRKKTDSESGPGDEKNDSLVIEIANTGKPVDQQDWEKINTALRGENAGPHLGLANIVNRLRLIYGSEVGIEVETVDETVVRVVIPQNMAETSDELKTQ